MLTGRRPLFNYVVSVDYSSRTPFPLESCPIRGAMSGRPSSKRSALLLAILAAAGCDARRTAAPAPNIVTVTAAEFHLDAPDTVPAGLTTLRLVTRGQRPHQIALLRIGSGKTFTDFMTAIKRPGAPAAWVSTAGGVNPPRAGGTAEVTMVLEPGTYAILCFLLAADGMPHVIKGEYRELTVAAAKGPRAAEPAATDTLTAFDFGFTGSAPITAGRHTFLFINQGSQPHEVTFVRLDAGKTLEDFLTWFDTQRGPPPGEQLGGVATMRPDQRAFVSVEFTPGEYLLLCFSPDVRDGRSHIAHGMMRQVTVR
jgi:hypothetical protein